MWLSFEFFFYKFIVIKHLAVNRRRLIENVEQIIDGKQRLAVYHTLLH